LVVAEAWPARQKEPAGHWPEHALVERPVAAPNVPAGHAKPALETAVLAAVCDGLTMYVPTPPVPVPSAVMVVVPAVSVAPVMTMPTARVPVGAAETVRVVSEMAPVTATDGVATSVVAAEMAGDALTVYTGPVPAVTVVPTVTP
jgi:hypothetical protein